MLYPSLGLRLYEHDGADHQGGVEELAQGPQHAHLLSLLPQSHLEGQNE